MTMRYRAAQRVLKANICSWSWGESTHGFEWLAEGLVRASTVVEIVAGGVTAGVTGMSRAEPVAVPRAGTVGDLGEQGWLCEPTANGRACPVALVALGRALEIGSRRSASCRGRAAAHGPEWAAPGGSAEHGTGQSFVRGGSRGSIRKSQIGITANRCHWSTIAAASQVGSGGEVSSGNEFRCR